MNAVGQGINNFPWHAEHNTESHLEGLVCSVCSVCFCYRLSFLFGNETGFYRRAKNGRAVVEILNSKSFAVFTQYLLICKKLSTCSSLDDTFQ